MTRRPVQERHATVRPCVAPPSPMAPSSEDKMLRASMAQPPGNVLQIAFWCPQPTPNSRNSPGFCMRGTCSHCRLSDSILSDALSQRSADDRPSVACSGIRTGSQNPIADQNLPQLLKRTAAALCHSDEMQLPRAIVSSCDRLRIWCGEVLPP